MYVSDLRGFILRGFIAYLKRIAVLVLPTLLFACTSETARLEKTVAEKLRLSLSDSLPSSVEVVSSDFRLSAKSGADFSGVETLVIKSQEDRYSPATAKANEELQDKYYREAPGSDLDKQIAVNEFVPGVLKDVRGYICTFPAGTSRTVRFRVSGKQDVDGVTLRSIIPDEVGWDTNLKSTVARSDLPAASRVYQDQKEIEAAYTDAFSRALSAWKEMKLRAEQEKAELARLQGERKEAARKEVLRKVAEAFPVGTKYSGFLRPAYMPTVPVTLTISKVVDDAYEVVVQQADSEAVRRVFRGTAEMKDQLPCLELSASGSDLAGDSTVAPFFKESRGKLTLLRKPLEISGSALSNGNESSLTFELP